MGVQSNGRPLLDVDVNEMSCDQTYINRIITCIKKGVTDNDLMRMNLDQYLTHSDSQRQVEYSNFVRQTTL